MLLKVNLKTKEIVSYRTDWPYSIHWLTDDQRSLNTTDSPEEFEPPFRGFLINEPRLVLKVMEAKKNFGEMEAVFDENDNLIDINILYPELGEDR